MGTQLSEILDKLEKDDVDEIINISAKKGLKLNVDQIPEIIIDNTDRNRTSPFAFTVTALSSVP